jgi:hypothetical protein
MRDFLYFYTVPHAGWPPLNIVVYGLLLTACWTYAVIRGGSPERLGTTILAVFSLLTATAIPDNTRFRFLESGVLVIDVLCLAAFVMLALRAERFWPLWVAALQLLGVASHGVKFSEPGLIPTTYAFMLAIWSYPMIALMIAGTARHQARLRKFGSDRSWSPLRKVT